MRGSLYFGLLLLVANAHAAEIGSAVFTDRREPPSVHVLDAVPRAQFDLGQLVFNSQWVVAGAPRAERRDGLGPLYVGASCDGCHNNGARGRGSPRDGQLPNSFVMQLGGPGTPYGDVLNTAAIPGVRREATVRVVYVPLKGRYADGAAWALRQPHYDLLEPAYGPVPASTVMRPRIGPALYGAGLVEAVPVDAVEQLRKSQPRAQRGVLPLRIVKGKSVPGRFGWQADAVSIQDQTERALAREMGLTSAGRPKDDCTAQQHACLTAAHGGKPEVSVEFLEALLMFQRELAVPQGRSSPDEAGAMLFAQTGCAVCHRPELPTVTSGPQTIRPYTDLLVHDMGEGLADRTASGAPVKSRWRTAPLWGLGASMEGRDVALLHDGRARSVEEAVLWHDGQAQAAQRRFTVLSTADRERLLVWVAGL